MTLSVAPTVTPTVTPFNSNQTFANQTETSIHTTEHSKDDEENPANVKTIFLIMICIGSVAISGVAVALLMYVLNKERKTFIELRAKYIENENQSKEKFDKVINEPSKESVKKEDKK